MLRHATRDLAPNKRHIRCYHAATTYTVVNCPGDEFPREAQFTWWEVRLGLRDGVWPDGIMFRLRTCCYTVRGGVLVNEEGGMVE